MKTLSKIKKFFSQVWFHYVLTPKRFRKFLHFKQPSLSKKDMEWAKGRINDIESKR